MKTVFMSGLIFSFILLCFKLINFMYVSWWQVFTPLGLALIINTAIVVTWAVVAFVLFWRGGGD